MIIYKITNLINDKVYVGQTRQLIIRRWKGHLSGKGSVILKRAFEKYGIKNFKFEAVAAANSIDELNKMERALIAELNSITPNGYNIRSGGGVGHTCTDELKALVSKRTKEAMACPILRKKLSEARLGKGITSSTSFKSGHQIRNKSIMCVETSETFKNQQDAATAIGVSESAISNHLCGKTLTCKKLTFKYLKVA